MDRLSACQTEIFRRNSPDHEPPRGSSRPIEASEAALCYDRLRRLQSYRTEGFFGSQRVFLEEVGGYGCLADTWIKSKHDADFIPVASRALYTLPRPMFSAVEMSVTVRPALKSFTASSAFSRADGLLPG